MKEGIWAARWKWRLGPEVDPLDDAHLLTMTRIRTRYRSPGFGIWPSLREGLRWLMRLPLRLLRRRDRRQLREAMAAAFAEAALGGGADLLDLSSERRPTCTRSGGCASRPPALSIDSPPPTATSCSTYATGRHHVRDPRPERFRSRRFPISSGTLPSADAVRALFQEIVTFTEQREEQPPAILRPLQRGREPDAADLGAWLVWRERLAPEEAVRRVQEARRPRTPTFSCPMAASGDGCGSSWNDKRGH